LKFSASNGLSWRVAWNIELGFIRVGEQTPLSDLVPDVFAASDQQFGFEDATSAMRDPDVCATWLSGWAILIDVNCRLSSLESFLLETSRLGELFVFRISELPIALHCDLGKILKSLEGNESFLAALEPEPFEPEESNDGELLAWTLMQRKTGVGLDDLWAAKFKLFALT
jgi:hypothetical protein